MRLTDRLVAQGFRRRVRGTGRIAGALYGRRSTRLIPTRLNGLRWEADPLDWMDQQVLSTGTYEPEIAELLLRLVQPGDVFWDVGANAGVHAVTVAARQPAATVVAFEPSPAEFVRLSRNAAANATDLRAFCIALADERGYRELSVVDVGNSGHNSLTPWPDVAYSRTIPTWCDTGDDLVSTGAVPPPNVLKVDVEGAEVSVLRGMSAVLRSQGLTHVLFEEVEDGERPAADLLTAAGFSVAPLAGGGNWLAHRELTATPG